MKLLRYGPAGKEHPGILDRNQRIRDLSSIIPELSGDWLTPEKISALHNIDLASLPLVEGQPCIGPCVGSVGKFICIGLNCSDHAAESGMQVPAGLSCS